MNSEPVLVSMIGWPVFIGLVAALIGWKMWTTKRDTQKFHADLKQNLAEREEQKPQDIGQAIGLWLINSCKMENFSDTQIALLKKSGIQIDLYYIELLCLIVFAASSMIAHASSEEFARETHRKLISEVRRLAAKETVISAVLDHVLVGKSGEYAKVLPEEIQRDRTNTTSPIGLKFLNFILPTDENKELLKNGAAPYYDGDGTLIRPPDFKEMEERVTAAVMLTDISMNYFYTTLGEAAKMLEDRGARQR
jgi:hypothetical protein